MADRSLQIRPIAGALEAEIAGVDLSGNLDGAIAAIRRAWLDHLVIFFRGQNLPPERFLAFARHSARPSNTRSSRGSRAFR